MRFAYPSGVHTEAGRIAGIYLVLGVLWIAFSDYASDLLFSSTSFHGQVQTFKGIFFIVVTAGLLHGLVARTLRHRGELERHLLRLRTLGDAVFDAANDAILVLDDAFNVVEANALAVSMYGFSPADFLRKNIRDLRAPATRAHVDAEMRTTQEAGNNRFETIHQRSDGRAFPVEVSARLFETEHGPRFVDIVRDITERNAQERRIRDLNRVYALSSDVNQMIVRERDELTILREACRIATTVGGFPLVWVGRKVGGSEDHRVITSAGADGRGTENMPAALAAGRHGRTPLGWVFSNGLSVFANDVENDDSVRAWRDLLIDRGIRSIAVLPIKLEDAVRYSIMFCASEPGFFNFEEARLLDEIAVDLSFALEFLAADQRRLATEGFLRRSEERLHSVFANMAEGVALHQIVTDAEGTATNYILIEVNDHFEKILNMHRDDVLGKLATDAYGTAEAPFLAEYAAVARTGKPTRFQIHYAPLDRYLDISVAPWGEEGFATIFSDVSDRVRSDLLIRESERRYRSLFGNMQEGYAYCRMIFEEDLPVDFQYLSVNDSFSRLTGLANVTGRKVSEVIPGLAQSDPGLFEIYGRVARGGAPEKFEIFVEALKMWFSISVYCPERDHFVAVFDVITARKKAEEDLHTSRDRLRRLAHRMEEVRETERKRIARDIHDGLGQELTAIRMALSIALRKSQASAVAQNLLMEFEDAARLTDTAIQSTRHLASGLRPDVLDRLGLAEAIRWQAEEFTGRTGLPCTATIEGNIPTVDDTVATALFRVFQEALTNVVRHAHARSVITRLSVRDGLIDFRVTDDGRGLQPGDTEKQGSLGILGMHERLELLGGTFEVGPGEHGGTTLHAVVPLGTLARDLGMAR